MSSDLLKDGEGVGVDPLDDLSVAELVGGPPGRVALRQRVQGLAQCRDVDRGADDPGKGAVVGAVARFHLVEEPHRTLGASEWMGGLSGIHRAAARRRLRVEQRGYMFLLDSVHSQ